MVDQLWLDFAKRVKEMGYANAEEPENSATRTTWDTCVLVGALLAIGDRLDAILALLEERR